MGDGTFELARRQGYRSGYGQARADALKAIDEAILVVGASHSPERVTRVHAMIHLRTIVKALTNKVSEGGR